MKCLERNRQIIYYANYRRKEPILDAKGHKTGEYTLVYAEPKRAYANVSPAKGSANAEPFGLDVDYNRIMIMDVNVPIEVNAILWVDVSPFHTDYDYVVKRVAKSKNNLRVAITKVDVNG